MNIAPTSLLPTRPGVAADASGQANAAAQLPATTVAVPPRVLNPNLHLDPGLGIVVTEYFNSLGEETQQFPTAKAIQRYQIFGLDRGDSEG